MLHAAHALGTRIPAGAGRQPALNFRPLACHLHDSGSSVAMAIWSSDCIHLVLRTRRFALLLPLLVAAAAATTFLRRRRAVVLSSV